jgi:uncharacterized protein with HEPN domain
MDKPTPKQRLEHILEAILLIQTFMEGVTENEFVTDIKLQSAVQYQFLVIGEAVGHIDNTLLEKYDYPWHIPRSFRNFIIHVYHGIKMERIYYAAYDLETIKTVVQQILVQEFAN